METIKNFLQLLERVASRWEDEARGIYSPSLVTTLEVSSKVVEINNYYQKKAFGLEGFYLSRGGSYYHLGSVNIVGDGDWNVEGDFASEMVSVSGGQVIIVRRDGELSEIVVRPEANELEVLGFIVKHFLDYGLY